MNTACSEQLFLLGAHEKIAFLKVKLVHFGTGCVLFMHKVVCLFCLPERFEILKKEYY